MNHPRGKHIRFDSALFVVAGLLFGLVAAEVSAQSPRVRAAVWKQDVYQGESFIYQITVNGARSVQEPNTDALATFQPREIPRQWLWSYETDRFDPSDLPEGRHFFYRLMSPRTGTVTIPSTTLFVDGRRMRTEPVTVRVTPPPAREEFKLELQLSKSEVYVGEPVTLNAVWYARDSASFYFANIPLLQHPDVVLQERSPVRGSAGLFLRMAGGSQRLTGERGSAVLDGRQYETMTVKQPITMRSSGSYEFPRATVQVWRSKQLRGRTRAHRGYRQTVVGSNGLNLTVKALPDAGKPDNFTGIVSETLDVRTSLSHTEMNVGDPVTLEIRLDGAPAPDSIEFPGLDAFEGLSQRFALGPDDMRSESEDTTALYTQTIRVKNEQVKEVPALDISFFNTQTERYETVSSSPIPVTVRETKVLTVQDLEGGQVESLQTTTVRDWQEGIRFNYSLSTERLENDVVGFSLLTRSPLLLALLLAPVLFFVGVAVRNRRRAVLAAAEQARYEPEPEPQEPEQDLRRLEELGPKDADTALTVLREYVARKLALAPAERTIPEIREGLDGRGVPQEISEEVSALLSEDESRRYWGGMLRNSEELTRRVRAVVSRLEEVL